MRDFLGKGTGFPFAVIDNKMVTASEEELVEQSIKIILSTAQGERVMRPFMGAGLDLLAFSEVNVTTATILADKIEEALMKWEPRIELINVDVDPDESEGNKLLINIEYRIVTSNTKRNLVYPFYLQGAE